MSDSQAAADILDLLAWYQAAGVDAAVGDAPVDWLGRGANAPGRNFDLSALSSGARDPGAANAVATPSLPPAATRGTPTQPTRSAPIAPGSTVPPPAQPRPQTPLAPGSAETEARRIARAATSLAELESALKNFSGCSLRATATNLCFYRGAPAARVMIVGEAPGRDEDIAGKPFVGRAGQLLDKMLAAIGLDESHVHITNVVYWRPPGNRTPTPQETLVCRPFLERQMELVNPGLVIALGGAAAKEVLGITEGIMRLRGRWREIDVAGRKIPAIATLHPAYLLRTPAAKQLAWIDLLQIAKRLDER